MKEPLMPWKVQNPKTKEVFHIEEEWDEDAQTDKGKEQAIAKGYIPVVDVVNPKTGESHQIEEDGFSEALSKGYVTPDVYASQQQMTPERISQAQETPEEEARREFKAGGLGANAEAVGRGFAEWGTAGFSDELSAAAVEPVGAAKQLGTYLGLSNVDDKDTKAYKDRRDREHLRGNVAWEESPWLYGLGAAGVSAAGMGAGLVASPGKKAAEVAAKFLSKEGLLNAAKMGAKSAPLGAWYAAGSTQEETLKDTLPEAGIGATFAFALAAVLPPLLNKAFSSLAAKKSAKETGERLGKEASQEAKDAVAQQTYKDIEATNKSFLDRARETIKSPERQADLNRQVKAVETVIANPTLIDEIKIAKQKLGEIIRNKGTVLGDDAALASLKEEHRMLGVALNTFLRPMQVIKARTKKPPSAFIVNGKGNEDMRRVLENQMMHREIVGMMPEIRKTLDTVGDLNVIQRKISDGMPIADTMSTLTKLDVVTPMRQLSKNANLQKNAIQESLDAAKKFKTEKTSPKDMYKKAAEIIKKHFGSEPPGYVKDYEPRQRKDFFGWATSMVDEAEDMGFHFVSNERRGGIRGDTRWTIEPPADLMESLKRISKHEKQLKNGLNSKLSADDLRMQQLGSELKHMTQEDSIVDAIAKIRNVERGAPADVDMVINRYLARSEEDTGSIANWARERDPEKLFLSYVRTVATTIAQRESIEQLESVVKILDKQKKFPQFSEWVKNVIDDTKGGARRIDVDMASNDIPRTMGMKAQQRKLDSYVAAHTYIKEGRGKEASDELSSLANKNLGPIFSGLVYGNYLSKPLSSLKNMASPFVQTMPFIASHIGYTKVTGLTLDAYLKTIKSVLGPLKESGGKALYNRRITPSEAVKRGLNPANYSGEQVKKIRGGMFESLMEMAKDQGISTKRADVKEMAGRAADVYSRFMLGPFSLSEEIARNTALNMSKSLTVMVMKDPSLGIKFVQNISDAPTKHALAKALGAGDERAILQHISEYVNAQTLFNYDRPNMAEFGRTMGPSVSMFSKWLTTIGGQVTSTIQLHKKRKAAEILNKRFLAPYLMAASLQATLDQSELSDNPRIKALTGDLKSWTGYDALASYGKYGVAPIPFQLGREFIGVFYGLAEEGKDQVLNNEGKGRSQLRKSMSLLNDAVGFGGAWKASKDIATIYDPDNRAEMEAWVDSILGQD